MIIEAITSSAARKSSRPPKHNSGPQPKSRKLIGPMYTIPQDVYIAARKRLKEPGLTFFGAWCFEAFETMTRVNRRWTKVLECRVVCCPKTHNVQGQIAFQRVID